MDAAERRLARVAAHLVPSSFPVMRAAAPPLVPAPTAASSSSSSSSSPAGDSYRRVHGEVSAEPPEWRAATDESGKEFVDIIYEKAVNEGIAKITINRPDRRNAFRPLTVKELMRAFNDARDDSSIGVIILTGKGTKAFCSGGDQALRDSDGYVDFDSFGRLNVLDLQAAAGGLSGARLGRAVRGSAAPRRSAGSRSAAQAAGAQRSAGSRSGRQERAGAGRATQRRQHRSRSGQQERAEQRSAGSRSGRQVLARGTAGASSGATVRGTSSTTTAAITEESSNMGDTEETVANQATEVTEVDKADEQQAVAVDAEKEVKKRKAMAPRSDVWNHFSKVKLESGEEKAKCKYCGGLYMCDTKTNELCALAISSKEKESTPES